MVVATGSAEFEWRSVSRPAEVLLATAARIGWKVISAALLETHRGETLDLQ